MDEPHPRDDPSTYHVAHWELAVPVTAPASHAPFGAGCAGSAGTPQLAAAPRSLPFVGNPFTVQLTGIPGSMFNAAFVVSGLSRTSWNGLPLPHDLTAWGLPGCSAWIAPEATEWLPNVGGTASKTWNIPPSPSLVGVEFFVQGAVMDPPAHAAWFVLSNAGTVHVGQV
ncbi:MAG: hypothetical protein FJ265_02670 [Planctomycetes bacterium]|nr:hypothetical protein [Planctomycetota bacterium]